MVFRRNFEFICNFLKNMKHCELVEIGYRWLMKTVKCSFAFMELRSYAREEPDVIGWKNGDSILVECKTSKEDFWADRRKLFRRVAKEGVGKYRFYLTPEGLLKRANLPENWGWLEAGENGVIERIAPKGNIWTNWPRFEAHLPSEAIMMQSALRRIQNKMDIGEFLKGKE